MAAPTFVACSSTANWTSSGSLTAELPVGVAEDDLLLLPIATRGGAATINLASGYSLVSADSITATNVTGEVQGKTATSSESGPGVTTSVVATQPSGAILVALRGWSLDLGDLVVPTAVTGQSQLPQAPAGTAPVDDCLVVRIYFHLGSTTTVVDAGPAGHTQRFFQATSIGSDMNMAVYTQDTPAAAGAVATATLDLDESDPWIALTIIVPPAIGGGGSDVTGSASADFTFNAPAAGSRIVKGSAAAASTFDAPAVGKRTVKGSAAAAFTFSADASGGGEGNVEGAASAAFIFNAAAVGKRTVRGSATAATMFNAPAAGRRTARGSAAAAFTFSAPASEGGGPLVRADMAAAVTAERTADTTVTARRTAAPAVTGRRTQTSGVS